MTHQHPIRFLESHHDAWSPCCLVHGGFTRTYRTLMEASEDDTSSPLIEADESNPSLPRLLYKGIPKLVSRHNPSNPCSHIPMLASCHDNSSQLDNRCVLPSPSAYSALLQQCGQAGSLPDGKLIHDNIIRHGVEGNPYVVNCLGYMYGHFGALKEARAVFLSMSSPDVFSWNFLIRAHALHGQVTEAFYFFHKMQLSGVCPDKFSFISILSACDNEVEGKVMHACSIEHVFERDILVQNALINFYGKCSSLEDAQRNFDLMQRRDLVSWNSIFSVYAQYGESHKVFLLLQLMEQERIKPDKITFITLLSASANGATLFEGQLAHALVADSEFVADVSVGNALVNMYGKCGLLADAWKTFVKMPKKDIISWNAIITAYVDNGEGKHALQFFGWLQLEGLMPNKVSLIGVLDACACEGILTEGKKIHAHVINSVVSLDVIVGTAIVHMYGKCKTLREAQKAFNHMPEQNLLSWNTIIAAYSQCEQGIESLSMFGRMQNEGVLPNHITFVSVISACVNQETLFQGKCIHALVSASKFWGDVVIGTSLVHMYGKHGFLEEAGKLFSTLLTINLVTWNAIITSYAQHEQFHKVQELCSRMNLQGLFFDKVTFLASLSACTSTEALIIGKQTHSRIVGGTFESDVSVANGLVNMYGKCNAIKDAQQIFESIQHRSVSSWNALLGAYIQNDQGMFFWELLHRMHWEGVIPDKVTFLSILDACSMEVAEVDVTRLHTCFIGNDIELDSVLGSAFINVYGKCGKLKDALKMFKESPKHKVDTWNALITVYAQNGNGKESLQLLFHMQREGIVPNAVTFVSVLCGCSHAGLVSEGCYCFHLLIEMQSIEPKAEHYNCMVDLFGRAGNLEMAEFLVNKMPFAPMMTSLLILLAACKHQANVERAERVTNVALRVDCNDPTPYIMLWNIYSTACEVESVV